MELNFNNVKGLKQSESSELSMQLSADMWLRPLDTLAQTDTGVITKQLREGQYSR